MHTTALISGLVVVGGVAARSIPPQGTPQNPYLCTKDGVTRNCCFTDGVLDVCPSMGDANSMQARSAPRKPYHIPHTTLCDHGWRDADGNCPPWKGKDTVPPVRSWEPNPPFEMRPTVKKRDALSNPPMDDEEWDHEVEEPVKPVEDENEDEDDDDEEWEYRRKSKKGKKNKKKKEPKIVDDRVVPDDAKIIKGINGYERVVEKGEAKAGYHDVLIHLQSPPWDTRHDSDYEGHTQEPPRPYEPEREMDPLWNQIEGKIPNYPGRVKRGEKPMSEWTEADFEAAGFGFPLPPNKPYSEMTEEEFKYYGLPTFPLPPTKPCNQMNDEERKYYRSSHCQPTQEWTEADFKAAGYPTFPLPPNKPYSEMTEEEFKYYGLPTFPLPPTKPCGEMSDEELAYYANSHCPPTKTADEMAPEEKDYKNIKSALATPSAVANEKRATVPPTADFDDILGDGSNHPPKPKVPETRPPGPRGRKIPDGPAEHGYSDELYYVPSMHAYVQPKNPAQVKVTGEDSVFGQMIDIEPGEGTPLIWFSVDGERVDPPELDPLDTGMGKQMPGVIEPTDEGDDMKPEDFAPLPSGFVTVTKGAQPAATRRA